nr:hypothetical transcript [Hymenolepis microstoma]
MNCEKVVLFLCLLLSTFANVDAIICYQCESDTQEGCYPLNKTLVPLTDCPTESKSCEYFMIQYQLKRKIDENAEPIRFYLRGCSSDEFTAKISLLKQVGIGGRYKARSFKCNINGCNPAGRILMMTGSAFIAAIVLLITYLS